MKIAGYILIVIAIVDFVGSYVGFDLWGSMGIYLPDILWMYSAYILGLAGYALIKFSGDDEPEAEIDTDVEISSDTR